MGMMLRGCLRTTRRASPCSMVRSATTNEDLPALAEAGKFRPDLLDRLAFDVITLPPLRERRDDILPLAEHFAVKMSGELGLELFQGFSDEARELLLDYAWPGNVRELKYAVERSVYRAKDPDQPIVDIVFDAFDSPYKMATPAAADSTVTGASAASCTFMPNSTTFRKNCNRFWSCASPPWTAKDSQGSPSLSAMLGVKVTLGRFPGSTTL